MEIIRYFSDYVNVISEGLIKTNPSKIVANDIRNSLRSLEITTDVEFDDDKINLKISHFNTIDTNKVNLLMDHILMFMVNRGGWFPSVMRVLNILGSSIDRKFDESYIIRNKRDINTIEIEFRSKFDEKYYDVPDKLYHLSIMEYSDKILKYGLVPKSSSKLKNHMDRIYLCLSIEDCEELMPKMEIYFSNERDYNIYNKGRKLYNKNIKPIIYQIDNSDGFIKFLYKDPDYNLGFYVLENIPPDKIKIIKWKIFQ